MSQRMREGRVVSVFTRLGCVVCPWGCRWRIIQTPGADHLVSEGNLIGLLCSCNVRSRKTLVGHAQWETDSGHPPGKDTSELGLSILRPFLLPTAQSASYPARCRRKGWPASLLCSRNARPRKGLVGRAQLETNRPIP